MAYLSVVIITFNEERNIERCLASVQGVADEIIVVDSFSGDDTKKICSRFGIRFIEHGFEGYVNQKNLALGYASHRHVLSLDADESLSEELTVSILSEKNKGFPFDAYSMNRYNNYCGQWINHGDYYPDRKTRLWDKEKGNWGGVDPHDKVIFKEKVKVKHLRGDLLHFSYSSREEHINKLKIYSTIAANEMLSNGKKRNYFKLIFSPCWTFIRGYFIKAGFLDGISGYRIAAMNSWYSFLKYSKLIKLHKEKHRQE